MDEKNVLRAPKVVRFFLGWPSPRNQVFVTWFSSGYKPLKVGIIQQMLVWRKSKQQAIWMSLTQILGFDMFWPVPSPPMLCFLLIFLYWSRQCWALLKATPIPSGISGSAVAPVVAPAWYVFSWYWRKHVEFHQLLFTTYHGIPLPIFQGFLFYLAQA